VTTAALARSVQADEDDRLPVPEPASAAHGPSRRAEDGGLDVRRAVVVDAIVSTHSFRHQPGEGV
jgi:hypothetical protein